MKFLLAFACILATAFASPYGSISAPGYDSASRYGSGAVNLGPAQPVGLWQVSALAPAPASAAPSAAFVGPAASYGAQNSGYGAQSAIDGQVWSLVNQALSLPNPNADVPSWGGYGAGVNAAYGNGAAVNAAY